MLKANGDQAHILIVDDEAGIRNILAELLSASYKCTAVGSAEEALELLRAEKFDLVISDIMMSGMSGLEMIPHVLALAPDTVIITISGVQSIESAIEALRVGAFDYIMKPFDFQHIWAAVRRALEHHALCVAKRHYESHLKELVEERTAELSEANASLQQQIAERERAEEKITYLACHDTLTGLPNRVLFEDRLAHALALAQRNEEMLAVMFLDLDRFKAINDTLGHEVGDRLLRGLAERLSSCVRESDTIARMGEDEFALLLTQITRTEDAVRIARDIHEALKPSFTFDKHELYLSSSIGISLFPHDGEETQTLLKNARAALCGAKEEGGNEYQFYTADMNAEALNRWEMESDIRRALERGEFVLYYQPQVEINTGNIVGMEALIRWQHPELGLVSPAKFIPLAEDTGLIVAIGEWGLRAACRQNRSWQEAGFGPLRMSVNLSARQFQQPDLIEMVARTLEETRLNPSHLELELTESSVMKNPQHAIGVLQELKGMGVHISIDDFGTGYSSLNYLKRLPLDVLKIDQSFVRDTVTDPSDAAIVMAIIALSHNLNLKVIAEGVETEEQLTFLRLLRCDEAQGYLISKPQSAEAIGQLLLEGRHPTGEESGRRRLIAGTV